ncbi:S1 family peptidase [Nonomuraea typhae]|uniref:S1 family peptidase n=1 Tax=Nonomuraea typhae TaxID=2603600 RepID=A0ABW7YM34_9ACTN
MLRRTPALVALAIGALIGTPSPVMASAEPPPDGRLTALQRDLGITREQAITRLAAEARAGRTIASAAKTLGAHYAGAWHEGPEAALVVATTSRTAAQAITAAQIDVVPRTLAQLTAVKNSLDRSAPPATVHSWAISPRDNAVVVQTSSDADARAWIAAAGADRDAVKLEPSAERPKPFYDIRGGDAYYIPSKGYRCSVGFAARRGTTLGFTTAGHCGDAGDATQGHNRVDQGVFRISSFPSDDYAWVETNSQWAAPGVVNGYSAGILPVRGSAVTQPGGSTCRSGSTTQWHCGTVQALNATVNYPEGTVYQLTRTNVCAEGGDSGGAFISGDQAQGMTSGGSGNCSSGGTTFFQPIAELLQAGGLTLVTAGGDPNPPTGCASHRETYTGSLTSGQNQIHPNGSWYQSTTSGTHAGCLDGPDAVDFDLYLEKWNGSQWTIAARGDSPDPDETLTYNGTPGYYRYRVNAYSGSGSYTMGLTRP